MPDFWYFVRVTGQDRDAHSFPGVLLVTFPLAVVVLFIFHALLKWPAISLMPVRVQEKIVRPAREFRWLPATRFALIVLSVALGIATHLVWDSFTHVDGAVVLAFPILRQPLFYVGRTALPAFKIAQHLSTVAGGALILVLAIRWYRRAESSRVRIRPLVRDSYKLSLLASATMLALVIGATRAYSFAAIPTDLPGLQRFTGTFAVTSITAFAILLLVYSVAWWAVPRSRRSTVDSEKALTAVSSR